MMLLHFDRPCQVFRQGDGRWGWTCWCCDPPLAWQISTADTWATAFDDADGHVRHDHVAGATTSHKRDRWVGLSGITPERGRGR